jgi:hypothetical protein
VSELFRSITLIAVVFACSWLPAAIQWRAPGGRTWMITFTIEVLFASAIVSILRAWHYPLLWWRTPLIFLAAVITLVYCWLASKDRKRGLGRR